MAAALAVPYVITRFPGHLIFLTSMLCFLVGDVMISLTPPSLTYWAVTFPSLLLVISGPGESRRLHIKLVSLIADLSFATGQLIVSNSVDTEFQGIAGGIVSMITNYSSVTVQTCMLSD